MKEKSFAIRHISCGFGPKCRNHIGGIYAMGRWVSFCASEFERRTGHRFYGTKRFKLVKVGDERRNR